jgi:hypothetical protein
LPIRLDVAVTHAGQMADRRLSTTDKVEEKAAPSELQLRIFVATKIPTRVAQARVHGLACMALPNPGISPTPWRG